jgi:phage replication-related protein YjqB (UPF0714/DUF867 family)
MNKVRMIGSVAIGIFAAVVLGLIAHAAARTGKNEPDERLASDGPEREASSTMSRWLRRARAERYIAPDPLWLSSFEKAFEDTLRSDRSSDDAGWHALGFETRRERDMLWLRESGVARGRGAYALRMRGARPFLLQAPHSDTDLGTGDIALRLFEESNASVLALNNARRDLAPGADQAHSPQGPFARMAAALSKHGLATHVVQLHGFSTATAQRLKLSLDTIVVGGGNATRNAETAACLRGQGFAAQAADTDTRELAGRSNAVGLALRRLGRGRFIHLEIGPDQRARLLRDRDARRRLSQCL